MHSGLKWMVRIATIFQRSYWQARYATLTTLRETEYAGRLVNSLLLKVLLDNVGQVMWLVMWPEEADGPHIIQVLYD